MRRWAGCLSSAAAFALLSAPSSAQTQTNGSEIPLHGETEESLREVARQINNPISTLWQLTFDNQILGVDGGGLGGVEPAYTGVFQPLMPVNLSQLGLGRFADFGRCTAAPGRHRPKRYTG